MESSQIDGHLIHCKRHTFEKREIFEEGVGGGGGVPNYKLFCPMRLDMISDRRGGGGGVP